MANGTLYYDKQIERWIYQYYYNGKRSKIKQKKNELKKDFLKRVTDIKSKINTGSYIESKSITIYELGLEIIENKLKRNKIEECSYRRSIQTLNQIKNSSLKDTKIQKVTSVQLQDFIDEKKIYTNSYIDKIFEMLGSIFKEALKRDYILKNPLLNVEKPKSEKKDKKIEAFSIEEQQSFLNQLTPNEKYRDIFIIALYTGMRMGEILALKVQDIDFTNKEIHIRRSLTKDKNDRTILGDTTKTYNSIRTIPITLLFEKELKHAVQNRHLNIYDLIFIQPNGELLTVSNLNSKFNRICANAGLSIQPYTIKRKKRK